MEYLCVWGGIIPAAEQPFTKITSENEIKIVIQKKYNSGSPDIKQEAPWAKLPVLSHANVREGW